MKKYKNKRTGDIAEKILSDICRCDGYTLPIKFIEGSPDWEEIIEKNYEILSFQFSDKSIADKNSNIFVDLIDKVEGRTPKYWCRGIDETVIHSIKRLSDGKIFTIGDTFVKNSSIKIKYIELKDNKVYIGSLGYICILEDCIKTSPKFTTVDGVDKYAGDKYYFVDKNKIDALTVYECSYYIIPCRFHNKEKAEESLIENSPCLSINDINKLIYSTSITDYLKQVVKDKLNLK